MVSPPHKKSNGRPAGSRSVSGWKKLVWALPGSTEGSQTTLAQKPRVVSPKLGSANRTALFPEPAKNNTFPVGSTAACTAKTWESKGSTAQDHVEDRPVASCAPAGAGTAGGVSVTALLLS